MKKPLIGISCGISDYTISKINARKRQELNDTYVRAVEESGGVPVIIPNGLSEETIEELAERLDAFVFSGGGDVDPSLYGKEKDETVGGISEKRDDTEYKLLNCVLKKTEKPVFGICRGVQMLNVAMGGTLIVDVEKAGKMRHSLTEDPREDFSHEITVKEGTRLERILNGERRVNSFHHQALDRIADGLTVTAHSALDQVVEAVEAPGERYILGVQWHPEELIAHEAHKALFEELVAQAAALMGKVQI